MHARAKSESLAETNRVAAHRERARSESESSASRSGSSVAAWCQKEEKEKETLIIKHDTGQRFWSNAL